MAFKKSNSFNDDYPAYCNKCKKRFWAKALLKKAARMGSSKGRCPECDSVIVEDNSLAVINVE